ncbi:hypothetical protein [Phenylobacterium sp.]|uniref:hypothetical protein n=1 Tax=Phenylobacterium sp. TaxID=1871053 RepID=UPI00120A309A|nr:hypothetical protein [Phenylobacterium sp.]THD58053.1 MAG: hypothetical protein E8A49_20480 [Phenylobacterium sp.]
MKPLLFLSACGLALAATAACAPSTPPTARAALDCPDHTGDLRLTGIAADKKSCTYVSGEGDQVSLRLIPVSSTYEQALQPIEQELQGELPTPAATADKADTAEDKASDASATVKTEAPGKASSGGASEAAKAAKQAADDALGGTRAAHKDSDGDDDDDTSKVSIGPGGVSVSPNGGAGDHADINLPGIHISADDDKAKVRFGTVNIDAGEDGATVRVARDVRLRGEAFSPERRGFRATFILAKDNLKDGWKAVGYEAAGPKAGPITVAVFKSREGHRHDVSEYVKRLVRRNGGV